MDFRSTGKEPGYSGEFQKPYETLLSVNRAGTVTVTHGLAHDTHQTFTTTTTTTTTKEEKTTITTTKLWSYFFIFSRVHATLEVILSVRRSVSRLSRSVSHTVQKLTHTRLVLCTQPCPFFLV